MAALWPGQVVPRTPSRTADWLEVAVGRFEAWKASAARSGARRALEFVKAWYPGLSLDQLATWRQQADTELARPAIIRRASAIADYTDTSVFAPEVDDNGVAQPEEWFGLNPADGEDSAEEIDSSDEGEEEEEEGEDAEPAGGVAGQPDRASSTMSRASASPAVGGDQAETR